MFSEAYNLARCFTLPVVISNRTIRGACHSMIGACVVVNRAGWVLTAAHLIDAIQKQFESAQKYRNYRGDVRDMEQDLSSSSAWRKSKVRTFKRPGADAVCNHSVWWGRDGVRLLDVKLLPSCDLALGRLEPFDPESVARYPVFKTPGPDYGPGRSLCRLGFSFHEITPTYDEQRDAFVLPPGSVPPPLFPIEGMLTRVVLTAMPGAPDGERGKFIETSSPGLRGQSGGPIFDTDGAVWALQSHTRHYPLGFTPQVPGRAKGQVEHQFLNVGVGAHAEPILQFLAQQKIEHQRTQQATPVTPLPEGAGN